MAARQRKGAMAVEQVDRADEDKSRPVDGLVKQGPFQGALTILGLTLPLVALHATAFPPSREVFWRCLPTAGKALAGPAAAIAYIPMKRIGSAFTARWFTSLFAAYVNGGTILCWWKLGGGEGALSYFGPDELFQLAVGVAVGILIGLLESVWPSVCYRLRWIDAKDPPPPLSGPSRPAGENPYGDFDSSKRWMAHCVVAFRSLNLVFLLPMADTLFFRIHLQRAVSEKMGVSPSGQGWLGCAVACGAAGLLWASVGCNYKGEWVARLAGGTAMALLAARGPPEGGWPLGACAAHAARNAVGVFEAVAMRRWYRWNS